MILNSDQTKKFETEGYLVIPDLMPANIRGQLNTEYTDLLNGLYEGWIAEGLVQIPGGKLDFWGKLLSAYQAGCDYFFTVSDASCDLPSTGLKTHGLWSH